jgi:hypothetical protein
MNFFFKQEKRTRLFSTLAVRSSLLILALAFSVSVQSQVTETCPQGDFYKCSTYELANGDVQTTWKGSGSSTTTYPEK